jgi:hypothetical protein
MTPAYLELYEGLCKLAFKEAQVELELTTSDGCVTEQQHHRDNLPACSGCGRNGEAVSSRRICLIQQLGGEVALNAPRT